MIFAEEFDDDQESGGAPGVFHQGGGGGIDGEDADSSLSLGGSGKGKGSFPKKRASRCLKEKCMKYLQNHREHLRLDTWRSLPELTNGSGRYAAEHKPEEHLRVLAAVVVQGHVKVEGGRASFRKSTRPGETQQAGRETLCSKSRDQEEDRQVDECLLQ